MLVPERQTILPFTKTTWEGTGVEADVAVHANDALRAAHLKAIRSLIEQTPDQTHKTALQDILKKLEPSNSAIMKLSSQGFADAPHGLYALPPTSWALVKELFKRLSAIFSPELLMKTGVGSFYPCHCGAIAGPLRGQCGAHCGVLM